MSDETNIPNAVPPEAEAPVVPEQGDSNPAVAAVPPDVAAELTNVTKQELPTVGPRGEGAPPDALSEEDRAKAAAEAVQGSKSTVTDSIDSIGNPQMAEENGDMVEHHTNIGPRGLGVPRDTYRV